MKSKIIPACIAIVSLSYLPSALCSEQNQVDSQPWLKPETSPHKVFMTADSSSGEQFDVWQMDTGYAYSVMDNIDLYVATRISNAGDNTPSRGFLSGVNYHFSEKLSLNSASTPHQAVPRETGSTKESAPRYPVSTCSPIP